MLADLSALSQCKKLIIPASSWGFWGGFLSTATEIHVGNPPHHRLMPQDLHTYYYHDPFQRLFWGRYDPVTKLIRYEIDLNKIKKQEKEKEDGEKEKEIASGAVS